MWAWDQSGLQWWGPVWKKTKQKNSLAIKWYLLILYVYTWVKLLRYLIISLFFVIFNFSNFFISLILISSFATYETCVVLFTVPWTCHSDWLNTHSLAIIFERFNSELNNKWVYEWMSKVNNLSNPFEVFNMLMEEFHTCLVLENFAFI